MRPAAMSVLSSDFESSDNVQHHLKRPHAILLCWRQKTKESGQSKLCTMPTEKYLYVSAHTQCIDYSRWTSAHGWLEACGRQCECWKGRKASDVNGAGVPVFMNIHHSLNTMPSSGMPWDQLKNIRPRVRKKLWSASKSWQDGSVPTVDDAAVPRQMVLQLIQGGVKVLVCAGPCGWCNIVCL